MKKQIKGILILIAFTILYLTGCAQKNELSLSGTIESTKIDANSEVSGKIISIEKDEGATVKKGDLLAKVDASLQELSVKQQEAIIKIKQSKLDEVSKGSRDEQIQQAEASVKAAKAKLDELNAGSRPEQIKQAEAAVENSKASIDNAKLNYDYWQDKYNKSKILYESNSISENELQDIKLKLDTSITQLSSLKEQLNSAQANLELLKNGATKESINAAQANYEQALAQLDLIKKGSTDEAVRGAKADLEQSEAMLSQQQLTLSKYNILSPVDGTYVSRNVEIGDIVTAGTTIGTVSDLSKLWINVFVPRSKIDKISLGQETQLTSKGNSFKGKITYIASEAEFTPKNVETDEAKENMVFKVKIEILDNQDALRPGMIAQATFPGGD